MGTQSRSHSSGLDRDERLVCSTRFEIASFQHSEAMLVSVFCVRGHDSCTDV
jgi:hypothetical protein